MKKIAFIASLAALLAMSPAVGQDTATEKAGKGGAEAGSVGAITGGPAGATAAYISAPDVEYILEYVKNHPTRNFRVTRQIAVGGRLPSAVTLNKIEGRPSISEYRYAVINGTTVLVNPATRQIVYILE